MTFVPTSSFAIREIRHGQLSLLHVLSVVTLVSLIIGIVRIRQDNVAAHRAAMRGSWFGLLGAAIGAIAVPERRIPTLAVIDPAGALAAGVAVVLLTAALIMLAHAADHLRSRPAATTVLTRSLSTSIRATQHAVSRNRRRVPPENTLTGDRNEAR